MKKILQNKILISLFIVFVLLKVSEAGESTSIAVSCSIPEVPGLNAPPFKGETFTLQPNLPAEHEVKREEQKTHDEELRSMIQEDTEKEIQLAEGETTSLIVETIYSR